MPYFGGRPIFLGLVMPSILAISGLVFASFGDLLIDGPSRTEQRNRMIVDAIYGQGTHDQNSSDYGMPAYVFGLMLLLFAIELHLVEYWIDRLESETAIKRVAFTANCMIVLVLVVGVFSVTQLR